MIYTPPAGYYDNLTCNGAAITASKTHTATIVEIMRYKALMDLGGRGMLDKTYSINLAILRDWWKALDLRDRERIADVVKWSDIPSFDDILLQNEANILDTKAKAIAELKKGSLSHTEIDIPVKLTPEQEMKERAYEGWTEVVEDRPKQSFDACKDKVVEDYYANYQPVASQYESIFTDNGTEVMPMGKVEPEVPTPEEAFKELMFEKNYVNGGSRLDICRKTAAQKIIKGEYKEEPSEIAMKIFDAGKVVPPTPPEHSGWYRQVVEEFGFTPFTTRDFINRLLKDFSANKELAKKEAEKNLRNMLLTGEVECLDADAELKTIKAKGKSLRWQAVE